LGGFRTPAGAQTHHLRWPASGNLHRMGRSAGGGRCSKADIPLQTSLGRHGWGAAVPELRIQGRSCAQVGRSAGAVHFSKADINAADVPRVIMGRRQCGIGKFLGWLVGPAWRHTSRCGWRTPRVPPRGHQNIYGMLAKLRSRRFRGQRRDPIFIGMATNFWLGSAGTSMIIPRSRFC
jgi:hypothetical protein